MTNSTLAPISSRQRAAKHPARRPQGRIATVIVLIVSLTCTGLLREVAVTRQAKLVNLRGTAAGRSTFGNMDSFALALLLGGLRGPLIMFLWPAIENQKADHDLRSVDTMIEWVRLLQPEFDTVHLFQIWNKAYNLSAMMASPANKYTVIMEAIDYADRVDAERPGDLNIMGALSNVYGGKLGSTNLPEFAFYGRQFRQETMTDAARAKAYPEETGHFQRLYKSESLINEDTHQWEPWLDDTNNIRALHLTPVQSRPADVPANAEWNDGSALQYLKQYQPFPYGISPLAMSYNYAKRAEVAQSAEGQKPLQLSSMVIDSQPALQLKFWEEDDARHARLYEARAFKISPVGSAKETEGALASVKPGDTIADRAAIDAALYYYTMAGRISADAIQEYNRHLAKPEYALRGNVYGPHKADMSAAIQMNAADHDYLLAIVTSDPGERKKLLLSASEKYYNAMIQRERTLLDFYTEDAALWATGPKIPGGRVMPPPKNPDPQLAHDKKQVFDLDESLVSDVYDKAVAVAVAQGLRDHEDDRKNYGISVARCRQRISQIRDALKNME